MANSEFAGVGDINVAQTFGLPPGHNFGVTGITTPATIDGTEATLYYGPTTVTIPGTDPPVVFTGYVDEAYELDNPDNKADYNTARGAGTITFTPKTGDTKITVDNVTTYWHPMINVKVIITTSPSPFDHVDIPVAWIKYQLGENLPPASK
jgi:hypothetical protein